MSCFFVSDLHGSSERYRKLGEVIQSERPDAVFLGGDLLPHGGITPSGADLFDEFTLGTFFSRLKQATGPDFPRLFLIPGNDDPRSAEPDFMSGAEDGLWVYLHNHVARFGDYTVFGYACVPPTPFLLKDWERYDVSRYVPPGGVAPEEGFRTVEPDGEPIRFATIARDLERLIGEVSLDNAIGLFHSPPSETKLDRAGLDGRTIDHVPLDLHVGSIAIRRFIEERQPLLTLHGHVHESTRLTGAWRDRIGRTHLFNAAHDGPELCLVRFNPADLESADRRLL